MKIFCWFGIHKWEFLRLDHYIDDSWGVNTPSTDVYHRCERCWKMRSKSHFGATYQESDFKE